MAESFWLERMNICRKAIARPLGKLVIEWESVRLASTPCPHFFLGGVAVVSFLY